MPSSSSGRPPARGSGPGLRLILAEDDVLLREGLAGLLEQVGYDVVHRVGDPQALLSAVRAMRPDLVITDIRMPPTSTFEGIDVARTVRAEFPALGILLLSAHVELDTAIDVLRGGPRIGYLLKSRITRVEELVDALERISAGGTVLDPVLIQELMGQEHRTDPLAALTARERQVLALMAEGRSNNGIAQRLKVSEGAVEKHVRSILAKLDLPSTDDDNRRVMAVLTYLDVG
jgi:DNA-binding NarL/FixJ family response regulator